MKNNTFTTGAGVAFDQPIPDALFMVLMSTRKDATLLLRFPFFKADGTGSFHLGENHKFGKTVHLLVGGSSLPVALAELGRLVLLVWVAVTRGRVLRRTLRGLPNHLNLRWCAFGIWRPVSRTRVHNRRNVRKRQRLGRQTCGFLLVVHLQIRN